MSVSYRTRSFFVTTVLAILSISDLVENVESAPVDVASGKPITAKYTCGDFGDEEFFPLSDQYREVSDRFPGTCLQFDDTYGPSKMNDKNSSTFWVSAELVKVNNTNFGIGDQAEITIDLDLEQVFLVQRIVIQMGDSNAPTAVSIMKSHDNIMFENWIYIVQYGSKCVSVFDTDYKTVPSGLNDAICTEGAGNSHIRSEEAGSKLEVDEMDKYPMSLKDWKEVRYLKIKFYDMDDRLETRNSFGERFDHYSIASIEVWAECTCNGLESGCAFNQASNSYECVCGFNSGGRFCEQCKPLFNQYTFNYGTECQECECHDHASECYFNSTIESFGLSVDKTGAYSGGGVCTDCAHNTTGINCEQCSSFFYRPHGTNKSDIDVCQPCACSDLGTTVNPLSGLEGDCLRVSNDSVLPANKVPGDCYCKTNVEGTKCDGCIPGFFNLTYENVDGCLGCQCHQPGTINGSSICTADSSGQCPCKQYTTNRQCSECVDEYYGLDVNNTQGCTWCNCDLGGSKSAVCDKTTGQCPCRSHVGGQHCNRSSDGFYVPGLHIYRAEFESWLSPYFEFSKDGYSDQGYYNLKNVSTSVDALLVMPSAVTSKIYLKYSTIQEVSINVTANVTGGFTQLSASNCGETWCYGELFGGLAINIPAGDLMLTVSVENKGSNEFSLDFIFAVPEQIVDALLFGGDGAQIRSTCGLVDLPRSNESCKAAHFSLMTDYFGGLLSCDCDSTGSFNNSCHGYGGQCYCKPGVGGRRCDKCLVKHFNFTHNGCTACDCEADHKICDMISGQCDCPALTVGRQCGQCQQDHWSWDSTNGCQACGCDVIGSASLQCNLTTGHCDCKQGVGAEKCTTCLDGYKNLTIQGCADCQCDVRGSLHGTCDNMTGLCPCKSNAEGLVCDQCKAGTFNLASHQTQGCLDCICMGITDQCDSFSYFSRQLTVPFNQSAGDVTFRIFDANQVSMPYSLHPNTTVEAFIYNGAQPFFQSSAFSGNLLGLTSIRYTTSITRLSPGVKGEITATLIGRNNRKLVYNLEQPEPNADSVDIELTFNELNWVEESTNKNLTRGEFLMVISDVSSVMLPLWYYKGNYTASLGPVEYTVTKETFTSGSTSGGMEQCVCGPGYSGLSCESCAYGYKRANVSSHSYFGVCVPCECNNHTNYCHPDTGECVNCQHDTAGARCELCADGFYGDSTQGTPSDCAACPCYEPRVVNNTCEQDVNGTVSCSHCIPGYTDKLCDRCETFYWGNPEVVYNGTCQSCDCHGNTNNCNQTTGQCLDCGFNTTGFNCQRCRDGHFGDASNQTCQECQCELQGTVNQLSICNHTTGQCPCLPGVNHRTCAECKTNFYGYSNRNITGCQECGCNVAGSELVQCNADGVCLCKGGSGGDKCDFCADGTYGLPYQACQNCNCDPVGTVSPSAPCEVVFGQCGCRPGVTNRQCDQCMFMHFNFSTNGCKKCGPCQQALGADTQALVSLWQSYWNTTTQINALQSVEQDLEGLRTQLNTTLSSLGISVERLTDLSSLMINLTTQEVFMNATVKQFQSEVQIALVNALNLERVGSEQLTRIKAIESDAIEVHADILATEQLASSMITLYESYIAEGTDIKNTASTVSSQLAVSFSSELQQVFQQYNASLTSLMAARQFANSTQFEESETASAEQRSTQLLAMLQSLETRHAAVMNLSREVSNSVQAVALLYNQTMQNKLYAESLFAEAVSELNITERTIRGAQENYDLAAGVFEETLVIYQGRHNSDYKIFTRGGNSPVKGLPCIFPFEHKGKTYTNCTQESNPQGYWCQTSVTGSSQWTWGLCIFTPVPPLVTGWIKESKQALDLLNINQAVLSGVATSVNQAKIHAQSMTLLSQNIQSEFQTVQSRGQGAVDAIEGFKQVITSLTESLVQAKAANHTVVQAMDSINQITVGELENSATNSRAFSQSSLFRARQKNGTAQDLLDQLSLANASLLTSVQLWDGLNTDWAQTEQRVNNLVNLANDAVVLSLLKSGQENIRLANTKTQQVDAVSKQLQTNLTVESNLLAVVQEVRGNVSQLQTQLSGSLITFNNSLLDMRSKVEEILNAKSDSLRATIDTKYKLLKEKLARAKELAKRLEQPVRFYGNKSVAMANEVLTSPFNEVSLEFRTSANASGLLYFAQGTSSVSEFTVQLVDGKVDFVCNTGSGATKLVSRANICDGCWFRVGASRYFEKRHLVVTKLSTGGSHTASTEGPRNDRDMVLDNQFYLGGLPEGVSVASGKSASSSQKFNGCLHNVKVSSQSSHLWQDMVTSGYRSCCSKPPTPVSIPKQPGVSFNGFGYLQLDQGSFDVSQLSKASLEFRSFTPDAVLLLLHKENVQEKYGVFLEGGHVVFKYGNAGTNYSLKTDKAYNDGLWHQLSVSHNSTSMELTINDINNAVTVTSETQARPVATFRMFDLSSGGMLYVGGSPVDLAPWNNTGSLAGCMRNLQLRTILPLLSDRPLEVSSAISSSEVNFDGCYTWVSQGLNVQSTDSYAQYNVGQALINVTSVTLEVATHQSTGVLAYMAADQSVTNTWYKSTVVLSLFNGNLHMLVYGSEGTLKDVVMTTDENIADGRLHRITLDFTGSSSQLSVDSVTVTSTIPSTSGLHITEGTGYIYLGGLPQGFTSDGHLPTLLSLMAGIQNVGLNANSLDVTNVLLVKGHRRVSFTFSTPPSDEPPLPYSTTTPVATTPAPTCSPYNDVSSPINGAVKFGDSSPSYLLYDVLSIQQKAVFNTSFVFNLRLKTYSSVGTLVYMASADVNPEEFLEVLLVEGSVQVNMKTSLGKFHTAKSLNRVDTGKDFTVRIARISEFFALITHTQSKKIDYVKGGDADKISTLNVNKIYIGGMPPSFQRPPFQGCVVEFDVNTNDNTFIRFVPEEQASIQPTSELGTSTCYANRRPGISFDGTGYALQRSDFLINMTALKIEMTFTSYNDSVNLLTMYDSMTTFLVVDLLDGQIRVTLGNSSSVNEPYMAAYDAELTKHTICGTSNHILVVQLDQYGITIGIDRSDIQGYAFKLLPPKSPTPMPIYVGGLPQGNNFNFPVTVSKRGLRGCISQLVINDEKVIQYENLVNTHYGCIAN